CPLVDQPPIIGRGLEHQVGVVGIGFALLPVLRITWRFVAWHTDRAGSAKILALIGPPHTQHVIFTGVADPSASFLCVALRGFFHVRKNFSPRHMGRGFAFSLRLIRHGASAWRSPRRSRRKAGAVPAVSGCNPYPPRFEFSPSFRAKPLCAQA